MTGRWQPKAWHELEPTPIDGIEPPHSDDAEALVIEACLAVPGFIDRVSPPLTPEAFYRTGHADIFRSAVAVKQSGPVDAFAVVEHLRGLNLLERAGGARSLATRACFSESEQRAAGSAAVTVWEMANLRRLALHCQQATAAIYSGQIGDQGGKGFAETFEARTFEICRAAVRGSETTTAREGFQQALREILGSGATESVSSGFRSYDAAVGQLPMGEYTFLGAATGQGKTAFGLNLAINVALRGFGALYVSTEMKAKDLMLRAACAFSDIPVLTVRKKALTDAQRGRLVAAAEKFKTIPIDVDDNFGQSLASIRSQVRRTTAKFAKAGTPLRLVVVDYIQDLALPPNKTATTERLLCDLSRGLKDLAVQNGVHVIALSQLNDNANMRKDKEKAPELGDIKGAKGMAFPAEVVGFLHRKRGADGKYMARGPVDIWIRKARYAPPDPIHMTFDAALGRFEDSEE